MRGQWCLALAAFVAVAGVQAQERTLTASEAKQHVGEMATVCGRVVSPRFSSGSRGQPTFLNFDKSYPAQEFTVLIWGSERPKFGQPEVIYRDKNVCVSGKIQSYRGSTEIVANDPKQIKVQER